MNLPDTFARRLVWTSTSLHLRTSKFWSFLWIDETPQENEPIFSPTLDDSR